MVSPETFERWVSEAIDSLPEVLPAELLDHIANVLFVVEDVPGANLDGEDAEGLLGLYEGVPLPERSVWTEGPVFPDVITLYQRNIEAISPEPRELKRQIGETLLHELGHYFGLDEDEMDRIEDAWASRWGE